MRKFAAWTVIVLGVMVLIHAIVLALGGPSLFGSRPPALFPSVVSMYGQSPFLGRVGGIIVPLCVGALALAIGCRMLSARTRGVRKHGKNEKA